jgi:hypothetical protein
MANSSSSMLPNRRLCKVVQTMQPVGCFRPYTCLVLKEAQPDTPAHIMRIGIVEKERHLDGPDRCSAAGCTDHR